MFFCFLISVQLSAQTHPMVGATQKSNLPVAVKLNVIPGSKKILSAVDTGSFVAIPFLKQSTPVILPPLSYWSNSSYALDTARNFSSEAHKSLYPVKNLTLKKE